MEEQGKVKNLRKNMKTIYGGRGILAELQRMINIPAKNGWRKIRKDKEGTFK